MVSSTQAAADHDVFHLLWFDYFFACYRGSAHATAVRRTLPRFGARYGAYSGGAALALICAYAIAANRLESHPHYELLRSSSFVFASALAAAPF